MRSILAWLSLLCGIVLATAAPLPYTPSAEKPGVPAITADEARSYAYQIAEVASVVAERYVRPVSAERLAAIALVRLHDAAGVPAPEHLRGDPDKALLGRDIVAELARARQSLGNPDSIRGEKAVRISLDAMLRSLDPYSGVIQPEDRQRSSSEGIQRGIGLVLEDRIAPGPLRVRDVILGGPAHQAGIRPGEALLEINGESVENLASNQAWQLLNREVGPNNGPRNELVLLVRSTGRESRKVQLSPGAFREESVRGFRRADGNAWEYFLDPKKKIGLIRLAYLTRGTADEVRLVMADLKSRNLRGLILDLRDCPGGLLDEAIRIADLFLDEGEIARVKGRGAGESQPYTSQRDGSYLGFPLVILIGPDTTGGGELIAAALQDHQRAALAGQRSRGKSSVQQNPALGLPGGLEVKFTTGLFVRPSGRNMNRFTDSKPGDPWGVDPSPELEVRLTAETHAKLREWRRLRDLRPAGSREALPLDHPEADPVQARALNYLLQELR